MRVLLSRIFYFIIAHKQEHIGLGDYMVKANLIFIRGDTSIVELTSIKAIDGSDYILSDTDKILLDIKKSEYSDEVLVHKEITKADYQPDGGLIIKFYPEDTNSLEKGEYLYDVRLYIDDYNIYTIIPVSKIVVVNSITEINEQGGV